MTIHVDWLTGSNDPPADGSQLLPFKTITKALEQVVSGDTIQVAGGVGRTHIYIDPAVGVGETFPLTKGVDDITIQGTRVPPPKLLLVGEDLEGLLNPPDQQAILLDGVSGWSISNISLDATGFDKVDGVPLADPIQGLNGVHIRDLPDGGTVSIEDCTITEFFKGIIAEDTQGHTPTIARTIDIVDTTVEKCGPRHVPTIPGDETDVGHAAIRLLEAQGETIHLNISDSHLLDNHDALEPGTVNLMLLDTTLKDNENGLEYASLTGGIAHVGGCRFENNAAFDNAVPGPGGVDGPTAGIAVRFCPGLVLIVRGTTFRGNQIGVSIKGEEEVYNNTFDFGSGFGLGNFSAPFAYTERGDNTFITKIDDPWPAELSFAPSHCGLFTAADSQVLAVGNTWKFSSVQGDDCGPGCSGCCNQGADSNGEFPDLPGTTVVLPNVNYDDVEEFPPNRGAMQVPWNYSTGPPFLLPGGAPSGFTSILLEPLP